MAAKSLCAVDGCDNLGPIVRGFCRKHYQRWMKHGDPSVSLYNRDRAGHICDQEGCDRPITAKGLCHAHYTQQRLAPLYERADASRAAINEISEVEAAYIAGMIDADGMVTVVHRNALVMPMVVVTNSNFGLITWLREVVGAGCAYEMKKGLKSRADQDRSRWNPVHRYQVTGRKAQTLLERCRPYMIVKYRQADLVISLPQRGRDFRSATNDRQKAEAAITLRQVRELNRRGRLPDHKIAA